MQESFEEKKKQEEEKLKAVKKTTTFLVLTELGSSLDFHTQHNIDGKVTRKKNLYKDPEGIFKILNTDQDKKTAKDLLGENWKQSVIVFTARYRYMNKKQAKAVKKNDVRYVFYFGGGKNPRSVLKRGKTEFRKNQDDKYEKVKYFIIDQPSVIAEVKAIWEKHPELKNPQVEYIAVDLDTVESDDIVKMISEKIEDPTKNALAVLEGFTVYAKPQTVIKILDFLPQITKGNLFGVFDYQTHLKTKGDSSIHSANQAISNIRATGASAYNIYNDFEKEALKKCTAQYEVVEKTSLPKLITKFKLGEEGKVLDARESCNFMEISLKR